MTGIDLSDNRTLAMRAKLSITHTRGQNVVTNWLLVHPLDQATADRNARMVAACASISGTNIKEVGDWNALAHCLVMSLSHHDIDWLFDRSGWIAPGLYEDWAALVTEVFGTQFVGNTVVQTFDHYGDAMLTSTSPSNCPPHTLAVDPSDIDTAQVKPVAVTLDLLGGPVLPCSVQTIIAHLLNAQCQPRCHFQIM